MNRLLAILLTIVICTVPFGMAVSADEVSSVTDGQMEITESEYSENEETVVDEETSEENATEDNLAEQETEIPLVEYNEYIESKPQNTGDGEIVVDAGTSVNNEGFTTTFTVETEGLYTIGMSYKATDNKTSDLTVGLKIDGEYPFSEASRFVFPRFWTDKEKSREDERGNTYAPEQVIYDNYYFAEAFDISGWSSSVYNVYLTAGEHECTVNAQNGEFELEKIVFGVPESAQDYSGAEGDEYDGEPIVYEAEDAFLKTSNALAGKGDLFSSSVTPNNPMLSMINYIGSSNWKEAGETIYWKINVPKTAVYTLGFSYRQSEIINGNCYRHLKIDGKTPFAEAEKVTFSYDDSWQYNLWSDKEGTPYKVLLTEGEHTLSLTVTPGDMTNVISLLNGTVAELGNLYRDITMITGESVDTYRDYGLFNQIPDMEDKLNTMLEDLKSANKMFEEIAGHSSGSYTSVINGMIRVIEKMLAKKYSAHRYVSSYYSSYSSLSASLAEMRNMPLDLDKIILYSPTEDKLLKKDGFFGSTWFSVIRFISSFVTDYNMIGSGDSAKEKLTVWVGWGRDQAQIFDTMLKTSFTPSKNIAVELKVVNATVVQALLSGDGPDCILQHSRTEPVNLAMRGALYDLTQFEDCNEVLERFAEGADVPYRYKGGLYALPDTQSFYMMFYRTDVFEEFGFSVPKTWEEFEEVAMLLIKNNLSVSVPYTQITDMTMVNSGVGSLSLFPTFAMQNGLSLYTEDGKSTNLSDPQVISSFKKFTDFYTKLRIPTTMSFFNRFRSGTAPLGIDSYLLYTTIEAGAPEIDGRWSMAQIPATVREDGSLSATSSAGGTGCAILNISKNKKAAWELLKWWTSAETQLAYSNNVESVLGPTGRISVSNTEALFNMSWEGDIAEQIKAAREEIEEVPEYPGSYYLSRALDHSFWNVVNSNKQPKDMLTTWGKEADEEIARKWAQYEK